MNNFKKKLSLYSIVVWNFIHVQQLRINMISLIWLYALWIILKRNVILNFGMKIIKFEGNACIV